MTKKTSAVVVCPGRGAYNAPELGYLKRFHSGKTTIELIDKYRTRNGQVPVRELDGQDTFISGLHASGENAPALIYACAMADFMDIDRDRYDIVAITGNSMGWYLAMAGAHALGDEDAIHVVNTMGMLMHHEGIGGQVVYSLTDDNWVIETEKIRICEQVMEEINNEIDAEVYTSIRLGGMVVFAGNDNGVRLLLEKLPRVRERYPYQLPRHAAFHSPLLEHIQDRARLLLGRSIVVTPELPLIDGRGHIWQPYSTNPDSLYGYTFGHQLCRTYDFSKAVEVAIKEFVPDKVIILGPGSSLAVPVAQEIIRHKWLGIRDRKEFNCLQNVDPYLICLGIEKHRQWFSQLK